MDQDFRLPPFTMADYNDFRLDDWIFWAFILTGLIFCLGHAARRAFRQPAPTASEDTPALRLTAVEGEIRRHTLVQRIYHGSNDIAVAVLTISGWMIYRIPGPFDSPASGPFAGHCWGVALLFVGIFVIVDLFEKIDTFVDNKASLPLVVRYYFWNLPVILIQIVPLACLLGSILSLGQMRRFNELTAMQGSGISPLRIATPMLAAALLLAGFDYGLGEWVVPRAYTSQDRIMKVQIKGQQPEEKAGRMNVRYLGQDGNFYPCERPRP